MNTRFILLLSIYSICFSTAPQADQTLATKSGCLACHQIDQKIVGPSVKEIAARHQNTPVEQLVATVKKGRMSTELTWGVIPMPASPAPEADVKTVIEWMLTLQP